MQTFNRKLFYAFIAFTLCMNVSVSFAGKWPKELAKGVMSYTKGEQKYGKPECAGEWSPKGKSGEKGNMVKACPIVKGAEKSWYKIEYKDEANGDYGTAVRDYPEMNVEIEDGSVWVVGTHGWWSSDGSRRGCFNVKLVWTLLLAPPDERDDCPKGEAYDRKLGRCRPFCKRNQTFDKELGKCVPKCPQGQLMDERLGECRKKCVDGKRFDYRVRTCRHPCPPDHTFDKKLGKCRIRCSEGEHFDHRLGKCRRLCPSGQSFDKRLGKCRFPCPSGEIFDYDKGSCRPHWMERQKWKIVTGKGYDQFSKKSVPAGTELEPGDIIGPVPGAMGVGIMKIGGADHGALFIVSEPTKVPTVVPIPAPKGKKTPYMKIIFDVVKGKIKGLLKGNKYCVQTENAVASCLGTAYQIITSPAGDEITVLEGIVNVLPRKVSGGLISLVPGESLKINRFGVSKRHISDIEYTHLTETFNRMFETVPDAPKTPENSDTWAPISKKQMQPEKERHKKLQDQTGWESIQSPRTSDRKDKSRLFENERGLSEENGSSY